MKQKKLFPLLTAGMIMLSAGLLSGCNDETPEKFTSERIVINYTDSVTDASSSSVSRTRSVLEGKKIENTVHTSRLGKKMYLSCTEAPWPVEKTVTTRGTKVTTAGISNMGVSASVCSSSSSYTSAGCGSYFYKESVASGTPTKFYWPTSDYKISFFGYYPYNNAAFTVQSAASATGAPTYSYTVPSAIGSQLDIMTGQNVNIAGGGSSPVSMTMKHRCAAINFSITNNTSSAVTVNSISIEGVKYTGTLNEETWTLGNSVNSSLTNPFCLTYGSSVAVSATANLTGTANVFLMLPQTIPAGAKLKVVVNDEDPIYADLSGTWEAGKQYNYSLTLSNNFNKPYDNEVLYLESTGTQYIDLDLKLFTKSSGTIYIETLVYVNESGQTNFACILNAMQEISPYPGFVLRYSGGQDNYIETSDGSDRQRVGALGGTQDLHITVNRSSSSVNNVSTTLFAGYDGDGNPWRYIKMRLYGCKIYDDGQLVMNLVPVVKDNEGYMYDIVSGRMFGNLGSGSFLYGNTVEHWWSGWYWQTLMPGQYKLECWGAQGGSYNTYYGGKGGYSTGIITIKTPTLIQAQVGGQGTGGTGYGTKSGGHNGGGNGYSASTGYVCCGGGGASDIRIETNSLYARVIVAGGGGGAGSYSNRYCYSGGYGGGTSGGDGGQYSNSYKAGTGGQNITYGTSYYGTTENSTTYGNLAAFGTGGGAKNTTYTTIAGGGGGWYGGGYAYRAGAGGGSGYVYTSSTVSKYPSGCLLNSSYYLTSAQTKAGNTSFPAPGGGNETGHEGDGYVRITRLD